MDADSTVWWLAFICLTLTAGMVILAVWLDTPTSKQRDHVTRLHRRTEDGGCSIAGCHRNHHWMREDKS